MAARGDDGRRSAASALLICFAAALVEGVDSQVMALAVPQMAAAWHRSSPEFALVFSATSLGASLGAALGGQVADRVGRKATLLAAIVGVGLLTLAISTVSTIPMLIALRFFGGLCLGGTLVSVVTTVSENSAPEHRLRNTMAIYTAVPLGAMLGALVGGWMFRFGDWRLIFYAGGGAAMLLAPVILLLRRGTQTIASPQKAAVAGPSVDGLFSPRYRRRTITLCATQFVSLTAIFCLMSWLPTVLAKATGSASTASLLTSLVYLGSVVGVLLMAAVINRVGVERLLVTILLVAAVTSAALHFTVADLGLGVIVGLILMGIGLLGGQVTLNNLGVIVYPPEMRGRGVGLGMGIGRIGALIGPAIGGAVLASKSYHNDLFLIVAVLILAAAGSVLAFGYARRAAGGAEEPA